MVNIMGADVLVTHGAEASATMVFAMLKLINSVTALQGLINPLRLGHAYVDQQTSFSSD